MKGHCLLPLLWAIFSLFSLFCSAKALEEGDLVIHQKEPKIFVPFTIEDFKKTGLIESATDQLQIIDKSMGDSVTKFEGSAAQFIANMSSGEKRLTEVGYTLRGLEDILDVYDRYVDPSRLRDQVLSTLGVSLSEEFKHIIKDPLKNCSSLPLEKLLMAIPSLKKDSQITLPTGQRQSLQDLVNQINDQQHKFCSLGIDFLKMMQVSLSPSFFQNFFDERQKFFSQYKIEGLARSFSLGSFDPLKEFDSVYKDVENSIKKWSKPGPEALKLIKRELNIDTIAKEYHFPTTTELPKATPPAHQELKLKKRKDWSGVSYGNRDRFAASTSAYYEVRGSEQEQSSTAYGNADIYIFSKTANIVSAMADFYASSQEVYGKVDFKFLGQSLYSKRFPKQGERLPSISKNEPDLFVQSLGKFEYQQQFSIGPIPVVITAGAEGSLGFGYEVGLTLLSLYGKGTPWLLANAYVTAAAGISGVLQVGAGASLTILRVKTPVSGEAKLIFLADGSPSLSLNILGDISYGMLDGYVYGFIEYPWPDTSWHCVKKVFIKLCWPTIALKTKEERMTLFKWSGVYSDIRILNWGLSLGPYGSKLSGDLIDQMDRQEALELESSILLEEKKKALAKYENAVALKLETAFKTIASDLQSPNNSSIALKNGDVVAMNKLIENNINSYFKELEKFIKN